MPNRCGLTFTTGRRRLFERAATTGTGGQIATLLSHNNLSFLLTGFLAVSALAGIVVHQRRHELRRLLSGGKAQKLRLWTILKYGLVSLAVLVLFVSTDQYLLGNRLYHALLLVGSVQTASPQQQFTADLENQRRDLPALESAQTKLEQECAEARQSCRRKVAPSLGQSAALLDDWETFLTCTRNLTVAVEPQKALRACIETDLGAQNAESGLSAGCRGNHRIKRNPALDQSRSRVRLLVAVVTIAVLFFKGVAREQRISEQTCPQCLATGSLEPVASSQGVSSTIQRNLEMKKCGNAIPTTDRAGHPTTVPCGFESRTVYQRRPKLCFPTLGIPSAGKTVWLVQAYKRLNSGQVPPGVRFERLKTQKLREAG